MKQILTPILFLLGLTCAAQPTYLDLFIQFDQYPNETSWVVTQGTDTLITSPDYGFQEYVNSTTEQTLFLESGVEYTFTISDDFGDGICCGFGAGYFTLENDCQGLVVEDLEFGDSIAEYTFTLAPCIFSPPTADVIFRLDLANAPPGVEIPSVLGNWNGWQVVPMENVVGTIWEVEYEIPLGNYLWKFADFGNPDIQELPAGVNDSPCFLFDQFGFINRTLQVVEEGEMILPPYCWESCLPCGGIPGCSDPNAINWNPWANFDNGTCIVQNIECNPDETLVEIIVTPDNFGNETSWTLYSALTDGAIASAPIGTYADSPPGIPISTFVCAPLDVEYDLVILDTYGDGLCGTCFGGSVTGNVQIFDCEGEELYNLQNDYPNGDFGYDALSPMFIPTECNTTDIVEGCTDSDYIEYNPEATNNDGSCLTEKVYGCLDETQYNWNPEANTEDIIESCEFDLVITDGVGDGWFGSWLGIWQPGFNSPQYKMGPDDGIEESFIVTLDATQPAYIYFFVTPQSVNTAQQCGFTLTNPDGEVIIDVPFFNIIPFVNESGWYVYEIQPYCGNTCVPFIEGCTSPTAVNYNDEANTDNESCYYAPGCTQAGYLEYYTQGFEADFDNGDCQTLAVFGCTETNSTNYDPLANVDNGACIPIVVGCTDASALNYNAEANVEDGSCIDAIYGCTDTTALNYNELANVDNGSCIPVIEGCMNPNAINFDPDANVDDLSCILPIYGCTDENALNYDINANVDNGTCIEIVEGCTNPEALNYNELANVDDFSCILPIYGCTDSLAFNYNELANIDNGTCIPIIEGCTDPSAYNYDPEANTEDFSCEEFIYGCTDPQAANYDEEANTDNGTCETVYANCIDPVVETYNLLDLGSECFAWVIDVSPTCCNNEWADGCQELYNYCDANTVTNVQEYGETQIIVFPNPTRDNITIASNLNVSATLYNAIGQPILQQPNATQIDMSKFEGGVYNLILTHNDLQFTKKIIKQ